MAQNAEEINEFEGDTPSTYTTESAPAAAAGGDVERDMAAIGWNTV